MKYVEQALAAVRLAGLDATEGAECLREVMAGGDGETYRVRTGMSDARWAAVRAAMRYGFVAAHSVPVLRGLGVSDEDLARSFALLPVPDADTDHEAELERAARTLTGAPG